MVDILSQQNAVGFDSTENMETDKPETAPKPAEEAELDEGELPEEGKLLGIFKRTPVSHRV
jgi:hypothetical protein